MALIAHYFAIHGNRYLFYSWNLLASKEISSNSFPGIDHLGPLIYDFDQTISRHNQRINVQNDLNTNNQYLYLSAFLSICLSACPIITPDLFWKPVHRSCSKLINCVQIVKFRDFQGHGKGVPPFCAATVSK